MSQPIDTIVTERRSPIQMPLEERIGKTSGVSTGVVYRYISRFYRVRRLDNSLQKYFKGKSVSLPS